jgi:hypothetical protein
MYALYQRAVRQRGASRQVKVGNRKRKGLHSRLEKAEVYPVSRVLPSRVLPSRVAWLHM